MNIKDSKYIIPDSTPELELGPDWLKERRRSARHNFNEQPLPHRGIHLWRYTDPNDLIAFTHKAIDDVVDYNIPNEARKNGVIVTSLTKAIESHLELVEPHLYQLVNSESGKLEAENSTLWRNGTFVYVPNKVTISDPIHLTHHIGKDTSSVFPRTLVVVGKQSEITLIDEYEGGPETEENGHAHINGAIEIVGMEASNTRYISLQRLSHATRMYQTHRARTDKSATMLTIPLAFGGSLTKQNFGVLLDGAEAESRIYGLLFGSGHQHFDNHTLHHHAHGETNSDIDIKVVLKDKAVSAYTGLIRIEQETRNCEAYQTNRNLLLNPGTRAETIPELEILNENVSCSHGATIGSIDPLDIFFLNSRGIPTPEAVRMIVTGFFASTLKQVPEDLRERINVFVAERLEGV
ncbi:MAG: Fe-S cluster assembly protein SufD [candidate division Zixibacteria bacterium]|nr:Fe-S cluster assembly protein SufD [candidate division Zixibacteria bacterium]